MEQRWAEKKCFKDYIKASLKKCNVPFSQLETLAADQDTWRSTCDSGLATFLAAIDQGAEDRHARRRATTDPLTIGPCCPTCNRICVSEFGLWSHLHSHSRPQVQQHNVVIDFDGLQQASKQASIHSMETMQVTPTKNSSI